MLALTTRSAADITPTSVSWLLPDWLPAGKLGILDGAPGVGKSTLTCDLAARLSRGELSSGPGVTVFITLEDGGEDTIVPRLAAAGADMSRIEVCTPDDFELPAHADRLRATIEKFGARLIVIDPISDFLGAESSMMGDQSVRRALRPLGRIAAETGCTILVLRHLRKREGGPAVYRGLGSVGLIAAARVAWLLGHHPAGEGRRVLTVTKTNLGEPPPAKVFRVTGGRLQWEMEANWLTAEDVRTAGEPTQAEWLRAQLARGPKKAKDVVSEALVLGLSERTLRRAKAAAQVVSKQYDGQWYWCLPGQDPVHQYCGLPAREDPYLFKSELEPVPGREPTPLVGPGAYDPPKVRLRKVTKVLQAEAKAKSDNPPVKGEVKNGDGAPPSPAANGDAATPRSSEKSCPPDRLKRKEEVNSMPAASSPPSASERKAASAARNPDRAVAARPMAASKPIRQPDPPVALEVTADLDKSTDDWTIRAAEVAQHLDKLEGSFEKNAAGVEWDRDRSGPLGGGRFMVRVVPRIQVGAKGRLAWAADWIKVIPWVRETRIVPQDGGGGGTVLSQAVMGASSFDLSFPGSARERTGLCGSAARDGS